MACRTLGRFWSRLSVVLVTVPFLVLCKPTPQDTIPSLLAGNHTVPGYVTRHAPLVWLHSEDPFRPSDLLEHIRRTTPTVDQEPIPNLPGLDLDNLALLNNVTGQVALTSKDDISTVPAWLLGQTPDASGRIVNATPCVVILVEHNPRDVDAFFFYFYSYDRGANITQVMEPLNRLMEDSTNGLHFGDHVGDWEHNMVRFRDGEPSGIYYSQHGDGAAYHWNHEGLSIKDGRPVVFSAYGSHANYASSGDHVHDEALIDYCDAGPLWDPVLSAYFYHLQPSSFTLTRLFPSGSIPSDSDSANLTSFFYYTGIWGDAQYPDSHPLQKTVPHFGLKRFVSGPQGPIVKQLVRKGLFPDHRGKKSWMEWAVGVFMSFYPCCVRGWRKWISVLVLVGFVLLVAYGTRFALRRYRRKGYKKIEMVPLDDLDDNDVDVVEVDYRR